MLTAIAWLRPGYVVLVAAEEVLVAAAVLDVGVVYLPAGGIQQEARSLNDLLDVEPGA